MERRYKNECYKLQTSYALQTQGNDFAKVFGLCGEVENDSRSACYQGLGGYAAVQSIQQNVTDAAQDNSTKALCMLGEDYEAWSNCVVGAVKYFILDYHDDAQAKVLCDFFDTDLHTVCLQTTEEFYEGFQA